MRNRGISILSPVFLIRQAVLVLSAAETVKPKRTVLLNVDSELRLSRDPRTVTVATK